MRGMTRGHAAMPRRRGVPIHERGPGASYRPDLGRPSMVGPHQPGIATPHFDHAALVAFDAAADRQSLAALLAAWTAQAERLMHHVDGTLTITVGLGAELFDERFGLARERPVALRALPPFPGDALEPARCGGDLAVLVAGPDAATVTHAVERLAAAALPVGTTRWVQRARLLRRPREDPRGTPRDVLGFRDGTNTLRRRHDLDRHVCIAGRERSWMLGGTFLVVRRIRVALDAWTRLPTARQEAIIGRHRESGAPLGARREYDPVPADSRAADDAHVRVAAPERNGGARMLRRSYSFDDGAGDAGLLFLAFVADPRRQYVPVQRRLAHQDALAPYLTCVASAVFAIPPGARPGGYVGEPLVAA